MHEENRLINIWLLHDLLLFLNWRIYISELDNLFNYSVHLVTNLSFLVSLLQALRMIFQLGVKPAWLNTCSTTMDKLQGTAASTEDLRTYMIDSPPVGDSVVPELLLKVLEPYRTEGGYVLFLMIASC